MDNEKDVEYLEAIEPYLYRNRYIELLAKKIVDEARKERDEK